MQRKHKKFYMFWMKEQNNEQMNMDDWMWVFFQEVHLPDLGDWKSLTKEK
jgi:hypothetical protein